jgi:hypothetical protein
MPVICWNSIAWTGPDNMNCPIFVGDFANKEQAEIIVRLFEPSVLWSFDRLGGTE